MFRQNRVVQDTSCYLRNEQLNHHFLWLYFKGEVLQYFYPWCVCRFKYSPKCYSNLESITTKGYIFKSASLPWLLVKILWLFFFFPQILFLPLCKCFSLQDAPPIESLNDFLLPESSEYVQDIYCIATQENGMSKYGYHNFIFLRKKPIHQSFCDLMISLMLYT